MANEMTTLVTDLYWYKIRQKFQMIKKTPERMLWGLFCVYVCIERVQTIPSRTSPETQIAEFPQA